MLLVLFTLWAAVLLAQGSEIRNGKKVLADRVLLDEVDTKVVLPQLAGSVAAGAAIGLTSDAILKNKIAPVQHSVLGLIGGVTAALAAGNAKAKKFPVVPTILGGGAAGLVSAFSEAEKSGIKSVGQGIASGVAGAITANTISYFLHKDKDATEPVEPEEPEKKDKSYLQSMACDNFERHVGEVTQGEKHVSSLQLAQAMLIPLSRAKKLIAHIKQLGADQDEEGNILISDLCEFLSQDNSRKIPFNALKKHIFNNLEQNTVDFFHRAQPFENKKVDAFQLRGFLLQGSNKDTRAAKVHITDLAELFNLAPQQAEKLMRKLCNRFATTFGSEDCSDSESPSVSFLNFYVDVDKDLSGTITPKEFSQAYAEYVLLHKKASKETKASRFEDYQAYLSRLMSRLQLVQETVVLAKREVVASIAAHNGPKGWMLTYFPNSFQEDMIPDEVSDGNLLFQALSSRDEGSRKKVVTLFDVLRRFNADRTPEQQATFVEEAMNMFDEVGSHIPTSTSLSALEFSGLVWYYSNKPAGDVTIDEIETALTPFEKSQGRPTVGSIPALAHISKFAETRDLEEDDQNLEHMCRVCVGKVTPQVLSGGGFQPALVFAAAAEILGLPSPAQVGSLSKKDLGLTMFASPVCIKSESGKTQWDLTTKVCNLNKRLAERDAFLLISMAKGIAHAQASTKA